MTPTYPCWSRLTVGSIFSPGLALKDRICLLRFEMDDSQSSLEGPGGRALRFNRSPLLGPLSARVLPGKGRSTGLKSLEVKNGSSYLSFVQAKVE